MRDAKCFTRALMADTIVLDQLYRIPAYGFAALVSNNNSLNSPKQDNPRMGHS